MAEQSVPKACIRDGPGWCVLMNRRMSEVRWNECKNKPHYFDMFLKEAKQRVFPRTKVFNNCIHRGQLMGYITCRPCMNSGDGKRAVYQCAIHGKCTDRNTAPTNPLEERPVACSTCEDYTESEE